MLVLCIEERFQVVCNRFLGCYWQVLFHVIFYESIMILVVFTLLGQPVDCLLSPINATWEFSNLGQLQTLSVKLSLHDYAPLVKIHELLLLHLRRCKKFANLFLEVYVSCLRCDDSCSESVNLFDQILILHADFGHEIFVPVADALLLFQHLAFNLSAHVLTQDCLLSRSLRLHIQDLCSLFKPS